MALVQRSSTGASGRPRYQQILQADCAKPSLWGDCIHSMVMQVCRSRMASVDQMLVELNRHLPDGVTVGEVPKDEAAAI